MDQKRELSDRARAVIVQLAAQYPACFHVYQWRRRPLAIGISALISVANVSDEDLKRALSFYTWNEAYLKACSVGAARIGLDGQSVGLVSESEAAFAANKLAGVRAREKQRRKAKAAAIPATDSPAAAAAAAALAADLPPAPPPPPPAAPQRLSMADLRAAAARRRSAA